MLRVWKKKLGDWCKNRSEDRKSKCSHYTVKSVARLMSIKREAVSREAKKVHGCLKKQLFPLHLPHFLNAHFAILFTLLTLCCTWSCFMPTNSNVHTSVQRVLRCGVRHTLQYVHLVQTSSVLALPFWSGAHRLVCLVHHLVRIPIMIFIVQSRLIST